MKKILSLSVGLILTAVGGQAFAQNGPGTGVGTNLYDHDYTWSNYVNQTNDYDYNHNYDHDYLWSTNCLSLTNSPLVWSNYYQHTFSGPAEAGQQVQNRFGKKELPADVQTIVQSFEQDRTQLMTQLKTCSDEQRQLILKDMEQLRTQMREQISKVRDDARQQAEQMRTRFSNNRDAILDQGAGGAATGRDR